LNVDQRFAPVVSTTLRVSRPQRVCASALYMEMRMHIECTQAYSDWPEADRLVVQQALSLLKASVFGEVFKTPRAVIDYLTLRYAPFEQEMFGVVWVDAQHRVIAEEMLFRGTLTQTAVYPREVIKHGLRHNAGGALLFHNHPGKCPKPSKSDVVLTKRLKEALALVGIDLLDHIIVSAGGALSMAAEGLL
jgi:DNA repair protein RadC